jgi:hypothetical protein
MESQQFSPAAYSPDPTYYVPDDDFADADVQWMDYCAEAAKLDRADVLQVVLSDLDADDSPLYELIDSAMATPHEPGRARESITVLAKVGQAILNMVAKAVDDQVSMRMAVQEMGR